MKKVLKITGIIILGLILAFNIFIWSTGKTYLYKTIAYNFVDIDDQDLFYSREIPADNGIEWPLSSAYNKTEIPAALNATL